MYRSIGDTDTWIRIGYMIRGHVEVSGLQRMRLLSVLGSQSLAEFRRVSSLKVGRKSPIDFVSISILDMTGSDGDVAVQCVNLALFPAGIWEMEKFFANSPSFDIGQCLSLISSGPICGVCTLGASVVYMLSVKGGWIGIIS